MSDQLTAALMSFADRIKNDQRSGVMFEGDWDTLQDAIKELAASKKRESATSSELSRILHLANMDNPPEPDVAVHTLTELAVLRKLWALGEYKRKLKDTETENECLAASCRSVTAKLEAAEVRIKASQEQRPYGYLHMELGRNVPEFHYKENSHEHMLPLFTQSPIPPELADLQRELTETKQARDYYIQSAEDFQRENAELRKLLEESEARGRAMSAEINESLESKAQSSAVSIWDGSVKLGAQQPPKE